MTEAKDLEFKYFRFFIVSVIGTLQNDIPDRVAPRWPGNPEVLKSYADASCSSRFWHLRRLLYGGAEGRILAQGQDENLVRLSAFPIEYLLGGGAYALFRLGTTGEAPAISFRLRA
ncbi:MAG: hypothetical protein HY508_08855, partial [Acidobacteria bacterium]|nr:hypothetical protein [Acidobacteriota bacterium]